jgi:RHS repeat-associated protein
MNGWDLYGSKRIGVIDTNLQVYPYTATTLSAPLDSSRTSYLEGQKQYELDNHLGNVIVTVNDKKTAIDTNHDGVADYYMPVVVNSQDYYIYGSVSRHYQRLGDSAFAYLFNSKLHDDDIYGKDNSYDYGMRMYDPRLGRFMSVDPLTQKFSFYTPYQFSGNKPIWATDLDGAEEDKSNDGTPSNITPLYNYGEPGSQNMGGSGSSNQTSKSNKSASAAITGSQKWPLGGGNGSVTSLYDPISTTGSSANGTLSGPYIDLQYNPSKGKSDADVNWVQTVSTNYPQTEVDKTNPILKPTKLIDGPDNNQHNINTKPEFYNSQNGGDAWDQPARPSNPRGDVYFKAETSLLRKSDDGSLQRLITFTWGFTLHPNGTSTLAPLQMENIPSKEHQAAILGLTPKTP